MRHVRATVHVLVAVDGDYISDETDAAVASDVMSAVLSEDGLFNGVVDWGYAHPQTAWTPITMPDDWMEGEFLHGLE